MLPDIQRMQKFLDADEFVTFAKGRRLSRGDKKDPKEIALLRVFVFAARPCFIYTSCMKIVALSYSSSMSEDRLEREVFQPKVFPHDIGHDGDFIVAAVADVKRPH